MATVERSRQASHRGAVYKAPTSDLQYPRAMIASILGAICYTLLSRAYRCIFLNILLYFRWTTPKSLPGGSESNPAFDFHFLRQVSRSSKREKGQATAHIPMTRGSTRSSEARFHARCEFILLSTPCDCSQMFRKDKRLTPLGSRSC